MKKPLIHFRYDCEEYTFIFVNCLWCQTNSYFLNMVKKLWRIRVFETERHVVFIKMIFYDMSFQDGIAFGMWIVEHADCVETTTKVSKDELCMSLLTSYNHVKTNKLHAVCVDKSFKMKRDNIFIARRHWLSSL